MDFREKFEAWHKAKFGYVNPPIKPFTALNCKYQDGKQQARWEGWQANSENNFVEGQCFELNHFIEKYNTLSLGSVPVEKLLKRLIVLRCPGSVRRKR